MKAILSTFKYCSKLSDMHSVLRLLKRENIFAGLTVNNKKNLLDILVSSFKNEVSAEEFRAIEKAVNQREKMISTGVGNGLAIPHGKSSAITNQHTALAVLKTPVDYNSFDGKPVSIAFLFAGPSSQNRSHLNMMSEISRLMNTEGFCQSLLQQQTKEDLHSFLKEYT